MATEILFYPIQPHHLFSGWLVVDSVQKRSFAFLGAFPFIARMSQRTLKRNRVVDWYFSPGLRMVVGKFG